MQQSIEAFVADMSAQLDAVDKGIRASDPSSRIPTLRRILYLLQSLKQTLSDEDSERRREASAALMAEFRQGMAALSGGLKKDLPPVHREPCGRTVRPGGFGEAEVVPFNRVRRFAPSARPNADAKHGQSLDKRIAGPHFSRSSDEELADVREQINAIVDRRRNGQSRPDQSRSMSGAKRNIAADPLHQIEMAWRMLPGIIRNLEQQLGKSISFVTAGDRIEVNRSLIDAIRVPLIYLTRNAADHGLETSQERLRCGKSPVGTIRISVSRDADNVVIELSDDGRGLDSSKMTKLAAAGFIAGEHGEDRSSEVTEAGVVAAAVRETQPAFDRGIGLDAVRQHIEMAGGRIRLRSRPGCGVTVAIRIPASEGPTSSVSSSSAEGAVCLPNFPR